jgi:hypothetical protein
MCPSGTGTGVPRKYLGHRRPVVDREARSDALLESDIAHSHYAAEQRGPRAGKGGEGLEVDVGVWLCVWRRDRRYDRDFEKWWGRCCRFREDEALGRGVVVGLGV